MNALSVFYLVLIFSSFIIFSECARILGVFPMPTPSHYILGSKLMKELACKGHDVTVVSPFAQQQAVENYRHIFLDGVIEKMQEQSMNNEDLFNMGISYTINEIIFVSNLGTLATTETLNHPKFQKLLSSDEKFELIILEIFKDEALLGLSHHFKCPIVGVGTVGASFLTNHLVGNPSPSSYSPLLYSDFSNPMDFRERLSNTLLTLMYEIYNNYIFLPRHEAIMKQYFKNAPDLEEIISNHVSMLLLATHPSISGVKPHVPTMQEVGGYHIDNPKPLPKDLQDFMDNAKDGVILFSLGSIFFSTGLPTEKKLTILNTFSKLKQKVLWKYENDSVPGHASNIKFMKWLPQNDIMAHPNLKVFITHGGLLSTTEAVHHGVPIIGIPIFGDQQMNVATAVKDGYALRLDYADLTEQTFTTTIKKIIDNPKYRENAKIRSKIFRDRPMRPIDQIVFWTEYVLRHKETKHLLSPAMDLHWTQVYLLDVISLIVILPTAFIIFVVLVFKRYLIKSKKQKMVKGKKIN